MKGYSGGKSPWLLLILLVVGGLIGSLLGTAFGNYLPILNHNFQTIGLAPTTINLMVITITFGVVLKLNVASIVGFLVALFIYFRM
ncbi:DUF4321 domain-containing protein [Thermanaerosceptrum fracticalcis]|uniref:DUF4321 domain-containing protein n=1 Tax=Thermanaerosceptrum fracticalcis TaxID=1712410 RepID=A0A7G6E675_THEFR|nr:DUF4321 domain-containing protein [Thermanaerosceptrum fracticalcis]QNB47579.1 DUF4321 domain-containing protein [Thermanaerosceptrum fracticalcis]